MQAPTPPHTHTLYYYHVTSAGKKETKTLHKSVAQTEFGWGQMHMAESDGSQIAAL